MDSETEQHAGGQLDLAIPRAWSDGIIKLIDEAAELLGNPALRPKECDQARLVLKCALLSLTVFWNALTELPPIPELQSISQLRSVRYSQHDQLDVLARELELLRSRCPSIAQDVQRLRQRYTDSCSQLSNELKRMFDLLPRLKQSSEHYATAAPPSAPSISRPLFPPPEPSLHWLPIDHSLLRPPPLELVAAFEACPSLADAQERESVVRGLPADVQRGLTRMKSSSHDIAEIVRGCCEHQGGLEALVEQLAHHDRGKEALKALHAALEPYFIREC